VPTYDYRCKACGEELEVFQSFSDEPLSTCAACGGELRKLFGAPGIAFKGSGFYKTDSRGSRRSTTPATVEKSGSDNGSGGTTTSADAPSSSNGSGGSKKEPAATTSSKTESTA
jgi:putative FmdB family regulatory protein